MTYFGEDFGPDEVFEIQGYYCDDGECVTNEVLTLLRPADDTSQDGSGCEEPDYVGTYDVFESRNSDMPPLGMLTIMDDRADLSYTRTDGELYEIVFSAEPCDVHGACGG